MDNSSSLFGYNSNVGIFSLPSTNVGTVNLNYIRFCQKMHFEIHSQIYRLLCRVQPIISTRRHALYILR